MKKKLTIRQHNLLVEALRRYLSWHHGESLTSAWTGLGHETYYRPVLSAGLMVWATGIPEARTMGWLSLTEKGAKIVQGWIDQGYSLEGIGHLKQKPPYQAIALED